MDPRYIAALCFGSARLYGHLQTARLFTRFAAGRPHEPEFEFFRQFNDGTKLLVDVGANVGQAAMSFAAVNQHARIFSLEPNLLLEGNLRLVGRVLGQRFRYRMCGLSNEPGQLTLHVPVFRNVPISTRASTNRDVVEAFIEDSTPAIRRRMGVECLEVPVVRFDDLDVDPAFVKIDVEGSEDRVLMGMRETLQQSRPILLIERSSSLEAVSERLKASGYRIYGYGRGGLETLNESRHINLLAVHDDWAL
jgi:FkbM family methyltransferase